jgi:dTDP-4-dehydrorhamnose reductase
MLLIGADGQLGSDLRAHFAAACDLVPSTTTDLDITDADAVRRAVDRVRPDVIVNTAAYHNPVACEENPVTAFHVNAAAVRTLALAARDCGARLVHFSTDYVFDGMKQSPYVENDCPNPLNVYGASKLAGEILARQAGADSLILRISGIYGKTRCMGKGGNFINTMLRLYRDRKPIRVVTDEVLTPTSTVDICQQLDVMLRHGLSGLYHVTNEGSCSWFEFARALFAGLALDVDVQPARVADFPSSVKRPPYSVLENAELNRLGLNVMGDWKTALRYFLDHTNPETL